MNECEKCGTTEKESPELYEGWQLCDLCMEQAHWDYQESMVE